MNEDKYALEVIPKGTAEIYYVDNEGVSRVEFVDSFNFPTRRPDVPCATFKKQVTDFVCRHGHFSVACEITGVKWKGPLGYHQGYVSERS